MNKKFGDNREICTSNEMTGILMYLGIEEKNARKRGLSVVKELSGGKLSRGSYKITADEAWNYILKDTKLVNSLDRHKCSDYDELLFRAYECLEKWDVLR